MIKTKKLLLAGCGVLSLLACPALAAQPPAADWSGSYIGGHAGYGWGDFGNDNGGRGPDGSYSNWMGGANIGHNWQFDHVVLGVEGDATMGDIESRNGGATFRQDWDSTIRARAGYSLDRILPYVTLGAGLTNVTAKAPGFGENGNLETGIAAGGGVDFALDDDATGKPSRWFGRVEYLYVDVPNDTYRVGSQTVSGGSADNMVRVGLNYKY